MSSNGSIQALPYGNPSGYWINRLLPHDANYLLTAGAKVLDDFYGYPVERSTNYNSTTYFSINKVVLRSFRNFNQTLHSFALYLNDNELMNLELANISILRSDLNNVQEGQLSQDQNEYATKLLDSVSLAPAKFIVTSIHQNLPITLVNNFPRPKIGRAHV